MKAVIVDLLNGQAAALCDDGCVVKLADAGYALGQIVELHERKRPARRWLRTVSAVAAAAVLLMGVGGGVAYAMPYGVVSLDANPSIEYTINRFDYVLSVEGVNEEGKELLASMDRSQLVHRRIGDALEASVSQLEAGDWLGGESEEILISAGTKREAHSEKLLGELENGLRGRRENLQICALTVSEEEINDAHKAGMSAGRRRMLRELGEREGEGFDEEDWAERPIGEIIRELDPARGQMREQQPEGGWQRGQVPFSGEGRDEAELGSPENIERQPQDGGTFPQQERRREGGQPENSDVPQEGGEHGVPAAPDGGGMELFPGGQPFGGGEGGFGGPPGGGPQR